jgi:hypothetical protein
MSENKPPKKRSFIVNLYWMYGFILVALISIWSLAGQFSQEGSVLDRV